MEHIVYIDLDPENQVIINKPIKKSFYKIFEICCAIVTAIIIIVVVQILAHYFWE
ncbi:hypothetical protein QKC54_gp0872 [Megavirus baoshan]|uniref:Uncharacterized protein n=1 Tax=Megavirus baoshan TaxID=2496520 RepID=A0A8K1W7E9_9VIRU|nr:hypothetical protein QKC54_gp0872 [Megavirus baoshan]UFX99760.1 hypothetical protein Mb0200 [Megavirus baoshan]